MTTQGALRRQQIAAFVNAYCTQYGDGPRTIDIIRAVNYRGHGIRERHLDKMALQQDTTGRWHATRGTEVVE